jgi:hypothetical protein
MPPLFSLPLPPVYAAIRRRPFTTPLPCPLYAAFSIRHYFRCLPLMP